MPKAYLMQHIMKWNSRCCTMNGLNNQIIVNGILDAAEWMIII
jgi:hypothetical protein